MDLKNREGHSHEKSDGPAQDYRPTGGPVGKGKQSWLWVVVGLVVVALAVVAGLMVMNKDDDKDTNSQAASAQHSDEPWQAVFLTNGQVYFGHIKSEADKTVMLENVYYLQVEQRLQPPENKNNTQPAVSLVKLGRSELHCPVDEMTINREQVLFWEELKDDSRVVKAINEYLKTDDVTKKCYETSNTNNQSQNNNSNSNSNTENQ